MSRKKGDCKKNKIVLLQADIVKVDADCVVNPTNEMMIPGILGVSHDIFEAAGVDKLSKACKKIGHCPEGKSVVTPGFKLSAKFIIHTNSPHWTGGSMNEAILLRQCYESALELAEQCKCKTIAFPLIAAGAHRYPIKEAWKVAITTINDYQKSHDIKVIFALKDTYTYTCGLEVLKELRSAMFNEVLKDIDGKALLNCINKLKKIKKIKWVSPGRDGNVIIMGYPDYPPEVYELFSSFPDYIEPSDVWSNKLPRDMTVEEVIGELKFIMRGERFCDGLIASYIESGSMLSMAMRIYKEWEEYKNQ